MMENCILLSMDSVGLHLSETMFSQVLSSVFEEVSIDAKSSGLIVSNSTFSTSGHPFVITGDYSSTVEAYSSTFVDTSRVQSGVIKAYNILEIDDCEFTTTGYGSGIYSVLESYGYLNVTNSHFTASYPTSKSDGQGNVIKAQYDIHVSNCTFSNWTGKAAVIGSYYDNPRQLYQVFIEDSIFKHCNRTVYSTNNVIIDNSDFYDITQDTESSGTFHGGIVYSTEPVTITNCIFRNTSMASTYGKGGVVYSKSSIFVINSTFINNIAVGNGGILYSQQNVNITNSNIHDASCEGNGGVVFGEQSVFITDSTLTNSTASNGGCIFSYRDVICVNSIMNGCVATATNGKGGAIYSVPSHSETATSNSYPNIQLLMSTFSNNSATSGGVLYTTGQYNHHTEITFSIFVLNTASVGGVASIGNTSMSIVNSVFNDNEAITNGAVFNIKYMSISILASNFSGNSADDNGGVFYGGKYSMNFTIANAIFTNNDADNGGVFYVRRHNSNIDVVRSLFSGNTAYNQGSVFDIRGVTLVIDRGTLIGNNSYSVANVPEADPDDYVINACASQVSVFGLGIEPDPIYPMYCYVYSQDNISHNSTMADTETTTMAITHSPTRNREILTTTSIQSKLSIRSIATTVTTEGELSPITSTVALTSTPTTAHISPHATTSSEWLGNSKQKTKSAMPSSDTATTTFGQKPCATPFPVINTGSESTNTFQNSPITIDTDTKPHSDCDNKMPTLNPPTTSSGSKANTGTTSSHSLSSTADTTDIADTTDTTNSPDTADTADTVDTTDSDHHPTRKSLDETTIFGQHNIVTISHSTDTSSTKLTTQTNSISSEISTKPSVEISDQHQEDQNQYTNAMAMNNKMQTLLQVTVSLLSVMVILMCMIMMALLVIACKNRSDSQRGGYSKLPSFSDHDANGAVALEETNAEYSFMEA